MSENKKSVSEKMREAELWGAEVAKIMNSASRRANKFLIKHGYEVSVKVDFHELEKPQQNQEVK